MQIRTAFIFGGLALAAGFARVPAMAASAACSGAALTEIRMAECLSPATRGIRPAQPATGQAATGQPATGQPATGQPATGQPATGQTGAAAASQQSFQAQPGLDLEIKFPFGSAELTGDAKALLQKLAHVLVADALASRPIKVVGHTDAAGSDELNAVLSVARAEAVSAYLAEQGVPGRRLVASGVGKRDHKNPQDPLAAENRRVEILPAG